MKTITIYFPSYKVTFENVKKYEKVDCKDSYIIFRTINPNGFHRYYLNKIVGYSIIDN